jgi:hypothetical protein
MRRRDCIAGITAMLAGHAAWADAHVMTEAINKAGRQHMLSQRIAKSYLARGQNVNVGLAEKTLSVSMSMFERQLAELKSLALQDGFTESLRQLEASWAPYRAALTSAPPARARAGGAFVRRTSARESRGRHGDIGGFVRPSHRALRQHCRTPANAESTHCRAISCVLLGTR